MASLLARRLHPWCCTAELHAECVRDASSRTNADDEWRALDLSEEQCILGNSVADGHNALPLGPRVRAVPTYSVQGDAKLVGVPLQSDTILYLKPGEIIQEARLSLYVNGFEVIPLAARNSEHHAVVTTWSPFSLIEKCQVKTGSQSSVLAVFKLTVFGIETNDRSYYFATGGAEAFASRDMWVREMKRGVQNVTRSLFPPHTINVAPICGLETTSTRIMAGYLLQCVSQESMSLHYCELHAYSKGNARLAIYENDWCDQEINSLQLTDLTVVSSRKGTHCAVFGIDSYRFCARTMEEKELWLRAVSNIKIKLMHEAPDPTRKDLEVFREAVLERIEQMQIEPVQPADPLIRANPRLPPMSPAGDTVTPYETEDQEVTRSELSLTTWKQLLAQVSDTIETPAPVATKSNGVVKALSDTPRSKDDVAEGVSSSDCPSPKECVAGGLPEDYEAHTVAVVPV